ncbi:MULTISPECIES: hypothetical protein [unclassified Commensalibacter]|nr:MULTISPECIES: hypothetical protein [unclassified Commensalibacter]MBH9970499.1 hypothetical protein [Commensalibacter sp. M0265]MBH9977806.1 hypothetical protein [Commensalibacter sp. M0266]MBH9993534.1 hypothetical protein [Commensalibacter sp. M0270]MBI0047030.1 hypothetical protein [Commensalibacter sp. M0267]MBI0056699.1 hypothetical protein [Commensalibacter sp. M0268]
MAENQPPLIPNKKNERKKTREQNITIYQYVTIQIPRSPLARFKIINIQ